MKNFNTNKGTLLLAICLGIYLCSLTEYTFAQSKTAIYNEDGQLLNATQLEFKKDHIVYQNPNLNINNTNRIFKEDILLCFYPLGVYYVYDKSVKDLVKVPYTTGENVGLDKIITKSGDVFSGDVVSINSSQVKYNDAETKKDAQLSKQEVVAILHRNGDYDLYGEIPEVAKTLLNVKDKILSVEPVNNNVSVVNVADVKEEEVSLNYAEDDVGFSVDKEEFKEKALSRTKELENYLHFIAGKQTDKFKANEAIESAVKLFLSEDNIVQVSSKDKTGNAVIFKRKIREYLTRLKLLKYDKVRISWSDISYVSDIRMGTDGNYYGVIVIKQKFEGYIDGELKYTDVTTKKMTVILKTYDKYVAGEKQTLWDVFLGDIGVVDTV